MSNHRINNFNQNLIFKNGSSLMPTRCIFYLTLKCNLTCKMCFQKNKRNILEMTLDQIKKVFKNITLNSLHLVGGELFVRSDIEEILSFFNERINEISIQTNASLLSKEKCDMLNSFENIREVSISIDGLEKNHDAIRGQGVYRKAFSAIQSLCKTKKINIYTVAMSENILDLPELYTILNSQGVNGFILQLEMVYDQHQYKNSISDLKRRNIPANIFNDCVYEELRFSHLPLLKQTIEQLKKMQDKTKIVLNPTIYNQNLDQIITCYSKDQLICSDIREATLKIYPNGDIMLCEALNIVLGNCMESSIEKIWNSEETKKIRKNLCSNGLVEMCSRCCRVDLI